MCFFNLFRKKKPKPIPQTGTGDDMLIVNNLNGFGAGNSLPFTGLTQKGYGYIEGVGNTDNMALSYANVTGGSAPAAGDLVCWMVLGFDSGGQCISAMSGWYFQRIYSDGMNAVAMLAKIITADEIASPATVITAPTNGSAGFWVAYSFDGEISISGPTSLTSEHSSGSAPANDVVDSSALTSGQWAVTMAFGTGTDGVIGLTWTGTGPDIQFERTNVMATGTADIEWAAHHIDGGQSVTISKGDDGNWNALGSGYFTIVEAP